MKRGPSLNQSCMTSCSMALKIMPETMESFESATPTINLNRILTSKRQKLYEVRTIETVCATCRQNPDGLKFTTSCCSGQMRSWLTAKALTISKRAIRM